MKPIILPPAIIKIVGQTELFNLGMVTGLREGKLRKPIEFCSKLASCHILLV